nr:alpha/beta fold hydrolase [uncultured Oscillibacter sp.]
MKRILLHGLGQTASSWRETIRGMESGEDILCPELFGLLRGRACTYENLYGGFAEYCAAVSGPLGLCGLSLGGVLALEYGLEHPDRVGAVALIGTRYVMPKGLLALQNAVFRVLPDRSFRGMGLGKGDAIRLCGSMADLDFRRDLSHLTCPALVICGERDRANRRAAEELSTRLPRARLLVVKGAGHEVNADAPEALGRALDEFFRTHET